MNQLLINQSSYLLEALKKIKKNGIRELIVMDDNKKLVGSVSDGDIRDYLIKFQSIKKIKVSKIMNKRPLYIFQSKLNLKLIYNLLEKKINIIPIVDKNDKLIDVLNKENIKKNSITSNLLENRIVIMSGGYGKRMKPFTDILPKALMPIKDKSVIEIIINKFISENFFNIHISSHYKHKILKDYISLYFEFFPIKYIVEKKPLGTIGSLSKLPLDNKPTIITNCDNVFNFKFNDVLKYHNKVKSDFTIVVTEILQQSQYGICQIKRNNKLSGFDEKPNLRNIINVGFYIVNQNVIKLIPKNTYYDIDKLIIKSLKRKIKIFTYQIDKKDFLDFGKWENYKESLKK